MVIKAVKFKNRMPEMDKIKILRVFSRLNIGGPAIHTILLTAGLNDNRFESILVKGSEEPYEGNMLYLAKEKGVEPIVIPEMRRSVSWLGDVKAFFKIYSLIKEKRPHIVHTHTAMAGVLGRMAGFLYNMSIAFISNNSADKVKIVHTFHGHVLHGYFSPLKSKLLVLIERFLATFTDKIITVSEKQREEILRFGIGNGNKVVAIPLGLELERFLNNGLKGDLRKELNIPLETKLVGIVARLEPIKSHKMFIDAAAELKVRSERLKVKFLIVGDGILRKDLEDYVKSKNLKRDIIFLGFRKDLERIYADLDIVTLTSLNEGSPVALIEAMASGKAIVATDVGGLRDLFSKSLETGIGRKTNGLGYYDQGILVKPGDAVSFATALRELLGNDELRKRMGEMGREVVYPKYDISQLTKDMKGLYREMLNNGGAYRL